MKAIRVHEFGGVEKMILEDVPDLHPAQEQILVKVRAAGVNPVDTYIRSGVYSRRPQLPYIPGMDAAGEVLEVGASVRRFRKGDRVYCAGSLIGAYAEQALFLESEVFPLPSTVSYQQGAAIGVPYGTAFYSLYHKARVAPGEWIVVHGASGGTGIATIQLARMWGMTVIGTAGTSQGREVVLKNGAHHALDHTAPDLPEQVMKLTGGKGVQVVVEMLANKNLGKDLAMLALHGRVVIVGNRGTIEINPRDAMARDAVIYGLLLFNASESDLALIHAGLGAALETGGINPVIAMELPLSEAQKSHTAIMDSGHHGKIVLIP